MNSATVHIPLTPLDHAPPRNYSCSLSYLPLKADVSPEQAFEVLLEGLHRTFVQLPWLSGRVWPQSPDASGYRPGQLEIRHGPVDINGSRPYQLKFNQLKSSISYEELKEAAFPTDSFKDESMIWAPFMPDINHGPEVLVAQANFIPGACVLAAGLHHAASDGVGGITIFKLWADHCRALQSPSPPPPVVPPGPESSDRSLLERIWLKEGTKKSIDLIDPNNWQLLGIAPKAAEPREQPLSREVQSLDSNTTRVLKSAIFYVPPAKFNALLKDCAQANSGISGNDAICALIWRCALRARWEAAQKRGKPIGEISDPNALAYLVMTVDGRSYFSQSLPPTYLGNLTCLDLSAMPLALLVSPDTSLPMIAQKIRDGASSINTTSLLDAFALARSVSDFGQLALQNSALDSTSMLVSPLLMLPTNSVSFGDGVFGNGGTLEAFRIHMDSFNRMTRLSLVLPRLAAGGVEFLLNLFEEEMELLLKDAEFKKYAMFLTN